MGSILLLHDITKILLFAKSLVFSYKFLMCLFFNGQEELAMSPFFSVIVLFMVFAFDIT